MQNKEKEEGLDSLQLARGIVRQTLLNGHVK